MKSVAKIFMIIGMVLGALAIFPLVVGFIYLKKLNNNEPLTTVDKVLVLLFVSPIAGILLFLDKEEA